MSYADLNTIHDPATGDLAPAAWGDQIRTNQEFLVDLPWCVVYGSGTQSVSSATWTDMTADSERRDSDAMHSTVTSTERITVQEDGRYELDGTLEFTSNATGIRGLLFMVNGTDSYYAQVLPTASGAACRVNGARSVELVAGDYVTVRAYQSSGGALNVKLLEFSAKYEAR